MMDENKIKRTVRKEYGKIAAEGTVSELQSQTQESAMEKIFLKIVNELEEENV